MAEKSRRRLMLEAGLAESPDDSFLKYGLALQCLRDGDTAEGRERLRALTTTDCAEAVAAWQQLGQSFLDAGEADEARRALTEGVAKARARGDEHAAAEMEGLLAQLD